MRDSVLIKEFERINKRLAYLEYERRKLTYEKLLSFVLVAILFGLPVFGKYFLTLSLNIYQKRMNELNNKAKNIPNKENKKKWII